MKTQFLVKIIRWFINRLARIPERDGRNSIFLIIMLWMASMIAFGIVALGNPTGSSLSSHLIDIGKAVMINELLFIIGTIVIAAFLSFLYIPIPRLFLGSLVYTSGANVIILLNDESGTLFSYVIGIGYSIAALCFGLFLLGLYKMIRRGGGKIIAAVLSAVLILLAINLFMENKPDYETHQVLASPIPDENPAKKGQEDYTFLTYGSGNDQRRPEFHDAVDILMPTVDASSFISKWGEKREDFWGFDPSNLPVNGRVWVPKGKGPFPIILMVHGNHTMEDFSTSGYDYLGELLASRGFVAISVDEDFINYSNISGIPNDDYQLRAWMLLQHLVELQSINQTPGNALYQKMNFDQIALIGHSRGGEAVAMAADHNKFFSDDDFDSIKIKAVVALAPTDVSVDEKRPTLYNTSYLLLQGTSDGDVNNFPGDRQYQRTYFDKDSTGFKSALYIKDANHSQFNTSWGRMDVSLPKGLFLDRRQLLDPEDQRQIAKVYISAFFEDVFHGATSYEKLFRDARYGQSWLPETTLINQYQNATYTPIVQFKYNKEALPGGVTADANGFAESKVTTPKDRKGDDQSFNALLLKWGDPSDYTIDLSENFMRNQRPESLKNLILTMANMNIAENSPEIQIELETNDGVTVQLPLEDFMPLPPVISTNYTPFGLLDDIFREDKYKTSWAPIFQTFELPFESFKKVNPEMKIENVKKIRLHFTSGSGEVLVEGIGLGG